MDKKEKPEKKKKQEESMKESESKEERGGFPEDVDFKKFLGCGG